MKNTTKNRILAGLVAIVAFVAINLGISGVTGTRLDLTEDKLFTLSEGTINILEGLDAPVEISFFYTPALGKAVPPYGSYATRVRDMLHEFEAIAGDNLIVNELNPEPFSETEDSAVASGMQGVPLEAAGEKVYFGVAGNNPAIDQYDLDAVSIPFFQMEREKFMELDLAKIVYRLANPDIPKVGIITGAEVFGSYQSVMQGQEPQPWTAIKQIQEMFVADQIYSPEKLIEYDPDILLLIHPAQLTDEMVYAVDQYIMAGGNAVFYVDPLFEAAQRPTQGMMPVGTESNMNRLFRAWGVEVAENVVVGDKGVAAIVNAGDQVNVVPSPYVFWLQLTGQNVSPDDAVTANVESLVMATPGRILVSEDSPLDVEPLILSSESSMEIDVAKAEEPDLPQLLKDFVPSGQPMLLAARLTGAVPSAFPEGPPEPEAIETRDGEEATPQEDAPTPINWAPHINESQKPLNVILVADADTLTDRFWVRVQNFFGQQIPVPVADNGTFLVNALDNLAGSGDLISLRSRGTGQRSFTKIAELEKAAEEQFREKERALSERMQEVEKQISEMQSGAEGTLSAEQEAAVDEFTEELLTTRKELREVNHSLRKDVEAMHAKLKFVNIGLMPILVAILALILGFIRMQRRRRIAP